MKRFRLIAIVGVALVAIFAAVTFASLTGTIPTGETVLVFEASDILPNPDPCICTHNFDPVVCGTFPNKQFYSNQCVANCAGATNCAGIAIQVN